ncbi:MULTISPECIES: Tim44 domain-containing protein [unclassified Devosia]|uniref:Tim44 domain-containing protein n=1 Tax=unclassified Devosia TaxID=196773 RepID=UPI00145D2BD8|nr:MULTISPECIES: Tim44 domain-containing protein [unclassified Devosia]MBJ6985903.1 Tim44 domain-containing protein [Devosia sp. MC521]QMW61280.1 Tim44 domain-containing protein [Devosia sp. MC521]
MFASRSFRFASVFAVLVMAFSMVAVGEAEARKGGSFGSRGGRTFQQPAVTQTAPNAAAPVQRSMTPNQQANNPAAGAAQSAARPGGFMSGFGGSLMRGLMLGGLIGLLMGGGLGGMGGIMAMIVQIAVIGGVIWLAMRIFGRRRQPQAAAANGYAAPQYEVPQPEAQQHTTARQGENRLEGLLGNFGRGGSAKAPADPNELGIGMEDLEIFESMLTRVQAAFSNENYAALRALTTPEIMGYLSEELATNATNGVKNEVTDVTLLQGDMAESWREGQTEYATVAMRYSAIDFVRERSSGRVVEGDENEPSESTELWTFVRPVGGTWQLSAIQEA